jgi:nitroreductase
MDVFEAIRTRRSIRTFVPAPIRADDITRIMQAARLAPSAGNLQAYEMVEVTGDALVALADAAPGHGALVEAPAAIVFCAHPARSAVRYGERGATLFAIQDATIACAYAQLAATALGLASLWIGSFDEAEVRGVLGVGEELRPVAILVVGRGAEAPEMPPRRPLEDMVRSVS